MKNNNTGKPIEYAPIQFRAPVELHAAFHRACSEQQKVASAVMRHLMQQWLEEHGGAVKPKKSSAVKK